jgi:hypothetical protein
VSRDHIQGNGDAARRSPGTVLFRLSRRLPLVHELCQDSLFERSCWRIWKRNHIACFANSPVSDTVARLCAEGLPTGSRNGSSESSGRTWPLAVSSPGLLWWWPADR